MPNEDVIDAMVAAKCRDKLKQETALMRELPPDQREEAAPLLNRLDEAKARDFSPSILGFDQSGKRRAMFLLDWSNTVHSLSRTALSMAALLCQDDAIKLPWYERLLGRVLKSRRKRLEEQRLALVEKAGGQFAQLLARVHHPDHEQAAGAQFAIETLLTDGPNELRRFAMAYALCFTRCSFMLRIITKHVPHSLDDAPTEALHAFELVLLAIGGLPRADRNRLLDHFKRYGAIPDSLDTGDLRRADIIAKELFKNWNDETRQNAEASLHG